MRVLTALISGCGLVGTESEGAEHPANLPRNFERVLPFPADNDRA